MSFMASTFLCQVRFLLYLLRYLYFFGIFCFLGVLYVFSFSFSKILKTFGYRNFQIYAKVDQHSESQCTISLLIIFYSFVEEKQKKVEKTPYYPSPRLNSYQNHSKYYFISILCSFPTGLFWSRSMASNHFVCIDFSKYLYKFVLFWKHNGIKN